MAEYLVRSAHRRVGPHLIAEPARPPARPQPAGSGDVSKQRLETNILEEWRTARVPLEVQCFDGLLVCGILGGYDKYSLLLSTSDGDLLLYKHGVMRVRPRPMPRSGAQTGGGREL